MDNIIFLDIDGVLQPFDVNIKDNYDLIDLKDNLARLYSEYDFTNIDEETIGDVYYNFDKFAIKFLKQLINETNSKIVIHSGWRETFSLEELKALFSLYGLDIYLLDVVDSGDKKRNIHKYIKEHNVKNYIVFDDLHMERDFGGRFSLCNEKLDLNNLIYAKNILLNNLNINIDDKEVSFYKNGYNNTFTYKIIKIDKDNIYVFIKPISLHSLTIEDTKFIFSELIRLIAYNNPEILGILFKYSKDLSSLFSFDFIGDKKESGLCFYVQYIDINYDGYKNINYFKNNFKNLDKYFSDFYDFDV